MKSRKLLAAGAAGTAIASTFGVVSTAAPAQACSEPDCFSVFSWPQATWQRNYNGTVCNVAFGSGACTMGLHAFSSVSGKKNWQTQMVCAGNQWLYYDTNYRQIDFTYIDRTPNDNDPYGVSVTSQDLGDPKPDGSQLVGQATITYSGIGGISVANVTISSNSHIPWYAPNGCDNSGLGKNQMDLQTVMTHEEGHTLGLNHPVQGPESPQNPLPVMACVTPFGDWNQGRLGDADGARYLYGNAANNWGTPIASPC